MEDFSDVGQYLRLPLRQIKMIEKAEQSNFIIIEAIAEKLKQNKRNFLPIIVEEVEEYQYKAFLNSHIIEAAQKANLDFVWCILADSERRKQIEVEAKKCFEVNMLNASEKTIARMLEYIKKNHRDWRIQPEKVAKLIVENRSEQWKKCYPPFKPLTKLKCGIGDKKLEILQHYFCLK